MYPSLALFTDFYELTMAQGHFEEGMTEEAVFSLFVRRPPPQRNFLLACGLDTVLGYLETLRFEDEDLAYLASLGSFSSHSSPTCAIFASAETCTPCARARRCLPMSRSWRS
jgi:nicotinic acid phosphoribosyltransferase